MHDNYKSAVDEIYAVMHDLHDDDMKRYVSGILTLMLPHDGDPARGVVQALFDDGVNKRTDLLRKMYLLFGMLLCNMGISISEAKAELIAAYKLKDGDTC